MPSPSARADPHLAAVLRELRKDRGLSQEALGHQARITAGSLARIELGQASPEWSTVRRIADALGVSMVDLAARVERER